MKFYLVNNNITINERTPSKSVVRRAQHLINQANEMIPALKKRISKAMYYYIIHTNRLRNAQLWEMKYGYLNCDVMGSSIPSNYARIAIPSNHNRYAEFLYLGAEGYRTCYKFRFYGEIKCEFKYAPLVSPFLFPFLDGSIRVVSDIWIPGEKGKIQHQLLFDGGLLMGIEAKRVVMTKTLLGK